MPSGSASRVTTELAPMIQPRAMRPRPADFRSRVGWDERSYDGPFDLNWRWGDGYYYPFQETHPEAARAEVEAMRAQPRVRFIMHHDDQRALVILFNWSDEPQRAKVTIDPPAGVAMTGQSHVRDAFNGEDIGGNPRAFKVDLLPRDFRMLGVRW